MTQGTPKGPQRDPKGTPKGTLFCTLKTKAKKGEMESILQTFKLSRYSFVDEQAISTP